MLLTPEDAELFFRLHRTLMLFVNQRLQAVSDKLACPEDFAVLPPEVALKVRDAFLKHLDLIEAFIDQNPAQMSGEELGIIASWRHPIVGTFYIFRELKHYTVFLSSEKQPIAYGVRALSQPFEELIGPYLPVMVQTVLLPFKDMIVYDGLMAGYRISFGPGIRRGLNESFKEAKARHGIVTSLPMSEQPTTVAHKRIAKPRPNPKVDTADVLAVIVGMIDPFCKEYLNEEYAVLCRKLAAKLARKRPSPLLSGSPNTWASGIVRTVGWVNSLHDKSQTPTMRLSDIDACFGIRASTGAAKLASIRKMLRIYQLDPNWTLPSRLDDNPLAWTLEVNGFLVDIRHAPRELQEIAFKKGFIPYIPADRQVPALLSVQAQSPASEEPFH